ncbi:MAG: hypothetical protein J3K34DRAFT_452202 [Monoraphidium minutum]|nr:MAG: hypothetical protein J3K34DRAFT_452202 [Monoraphidium minutum]
MPCHWRARQFLEGLLSGLLLIFFSELGDKTFFIALLLALRRDKRAVFAGTFGALAVMTVLSTALGQAFHHLGELLPAGAARLDDVLAVALLLFFGLATLKARSGGWGAGMARRGAEARHADARAAEEEREADAAVASLGAAAAAAALVASTFGLVFAAEWGDKSFLATIALAAAHDPAGVVAGAVLGHGLATGLAVAGGGLLGARVSERSAHYVGGGLFLLFALAELADLLG